MTENFKEWVRIENFKEWVEYFVELERLGIAVSLSDMRRKANELKLPIPKEFSGDKK